MPRLPPRLPLKSTLAWPSQGLPHQTAFTALRSFRPFAYREFGMDWTLLIAQTLIQQPTSYSGLLLSY